ncbi:Flavin-binding monooxygenase family protein [Perilla frutescens var. hirtella]|uniref:Flavin-binding monooxygenase family protein n=1 Tax=Perilla frutescens var. hirtella TaxID=608512 RepID=A0AAD4JBJ5_PERFH|nr:Flavin-binding monooxygenase family protein [Perilla frutescens var. hirtella]
MWGVSTFSVGMLLLKWLPLKLVDKFLLLVAHFNLGNTAKVSLHRPKTGPLELKNATGKTPVLDVGALSLIKAGKIQKLPKLNSNPTNTVRHEPITLDDCGLTFTP